MRSAWLRKECDEKYSGKCRRILNDAAVVRRHVDVDSLDEMVARHAPKL